MLVVLVTAALTGFAHRGEHVPEAAAQPVPAGVAAAAGDSETSTTAT
jgi:hypothetical protein